LFNIFSGNDHTVREAAAGELVTLVAEAARRWYTTPPTPRDIEVVLELLGSVRAPRSAPVGHRIGVRPFPGDRRQHTFDEISLLGAAAGLEVIEFLGLHPHPFPPAVEPSAAAEYNAAAWSLQQAPRNPLVLMSSSSAAAVLRAAM